MINKLSRFVIVVVSFIFCTSEASFAAPRGFTLRGSRLASVTVGGRTAYCGLLPNRRTGFVPVKSVGNGRYVEISRNRNRAHTNACKYARAVNSTTVSLAQLPSSNTVVGQTAGNNSISTVSGTPPLIADLRTADISSLFWRSNVVSTIATGSPTQEQCNEFWGSSITDGVSSGFSGCYLAQNVGESLQRVLQAGTNLCYMRNIPTTANLAAGAIQLTSGSLPAGGITNVFTTPSGSSSRLVRIVAASGDDQSNIYLRIYSSGENSGSGDRYRANMWFCEGNQNSPQEVVQMRFLGTDQFTVTSWNSSTESPQGAALSEVSGFLSRSGNSYVFDTSRARAVESSYVTDDNSNRWSSSMTIGNDNVIRSKVWSIFGSTENRKSYSMMRFSGSSATTLRFEAGAYKDSFIQNAQTFSNIVGSEFREPTYLSAPAVSLISDLADVDLTTDPFFLTTPSISFDLTPFSCSATPNVELSMQMTHPAIAPIQALCEGEQLRDMNFCNANSTVSAAQQRWFSVCSS